MMSIKILIAEDSASDRLIIRKMLSEYYILIACDGLEAMQLIQEHKDIDLLILDLNMPKMDGFEVLSELKTDNRYKKIRTIILTNYDELENEIKGLRFGAVDYVRKPIQMESLKARIDVHVELIKAQQALEYKIHEQGLTFDTVFNQAPVGIAISFSNDSIANEQNSHFSINPMYEKITGRTEEELKKIGWATITHPDDLEEDLRNYDKLKSGEIDSYSMEKRLIKKDGSIVWVYLIMASLDLSGDYHYNHIALLQDITTRKKIEADLIESERSKSVLLSHLPGLAYRCNYDTERTMQYVSDGCLELTGYSPESLLYNKELSFKEIVAPEFRESVWKKWHYCLISQSSFNYEYEIITARGERKWVLEMGEGIFNENSEIKALEGIIIDITDRKAMENILKYNNEHDSWTGLYNRNYLEELLIKDGKKQNTKKRALININMTAVQSLTMAYGFHYTQDLIKEIVDVLNAHCTDTRQLFYTYENQFVFYLKGYQYKKQLTDFCDEVANTLESLLAAERVRGGIGVVEIDQNNKNDVDQLLKNILIASEEAFAIGDRDFGICFYDTEIETQMIREQDIKRELAQIAAGENGDCLFLQYQPILDLKTNQISGFEALARFKSSQLGLIPPLEFIPIAEESKLIIPIGDKVILQSFSFLNKLKEHGYANVKISINFSIIQLLKKDFCEKLFKMISKMRVIPSNIGIEITESVFESDYEKINRILGRLKKAGFIIAIDDFGTGYSSLARERELNINCLKIDQSFIDKLMYLEPEKTITDDIISMAHNLGHYVIAEGVEHEKQKQYLQRHGCDKIQGYLISKPLDEDIAIEFLRKYKSIENQ